MKNHNKKAKTKLRRRILATFSAVLFFSFLLIGIIFNVVLRIFASDEANFTALEAFAGRADLILIFIVGIMFLVSVVATFFLSNSITRPIEQLSRFAQGIGKGNFDANDFEFQDEELENLNTAFNKSVQQLSVYDKTQKDFFQNASHELRTPLMSIKVYAEGIVYGLMDSKQAGETILEETDRLSDLVTDLLYIAKIDNSKSYITESANLIQIIRDCAERQQAIADKKQIDIVLDFDEERSHYECVTDLISRAVDNLLSNAVRYAETQIVISCKKSDGFMRIAVSDDGCGIEFDLLPHVFERFYKGKGGNTGIGLAIVKSITEQHRGYVKAENNDSGGAAFTITLPLTPNH